MGCLMYIVVDEIIHALGYAVVVDRLGLQISTFSLGVTSLYKP